MTKQQRIALINKYITQARDRFAEELGFRRNLKRTLESFPLYVKITKEFKETPKDYEEFLKLRKKNDYDPLLEWN